MNKLSLVGMQLPEKYKQNFAVSSEVPSSGVNSTGRAFARNVEILLRPYIFPVVASQQRKFVNSSCSCERGLPESSSEWDEYFSAHIAFSKYFLL
jgi:hypothetical protein